jgi:hypothetical protein
MTPKEKAKYLFDNFYNLCFNPEAYRDENEDNAKQCALIAVDEIYNGGLHLLYGAYLDEFEDKQNYYSYWEDVKQEINNLK